MLAWNAANLWVRDRTEVVGFRLIRVIRKDDHGVYCVVSYVLDGQPGKDRIRFLDIVFGLARLACDRSPGDIARCNGIPIGRRRWLDNLGPALVTCRPNTVRFWPAEFVNETAREVTHDTGLSDGAAKPSVPRVRGRTDREEDVRIDERVSIG